MKWIKDLTKRAKFIFRYIVRFFTPNRKQRRKTVKVFGLTRTRYPMWRGWWYRARRVRT